MKEFASLVKRSNLKFGLHLLLAIIFNYLPIEGTSQWIEKNNGLYGGYISAMTVSGSNLFAGTGNGVFLSTNNGTTWSGVSAGLTNLNISCLAVSGSNLFAGTLYGSGVFLSTNNGTSWTAVNTGLTNLDVISLAVSGSNIFAGTLGGGVFLSTNGGASWTAVNTGLTDLNITSLVVSGANLFAGASNGGGVFLSTNNGAIWTAVNIGLTTLDISSLAVSGSNLFAGTYSSGVFLTTNNGTSWTAVNSGLTTLNVNALGVSGSNIFAGTSAGVFLSSNSGASWSAVNNGLSTPNTACFAVSGTNLFAGTSGGVFLSTNNGANWTIVNSGLKASSVSCITMSGTNLFAGTSCGVFLSTNNGASWTGVNAGLTSLNILSFAVSGTNLFAGTDDGVFLSTNNGASWSAASSGLPASSQVDALAVNGSNLFAGTYGGGVFLSTNSGASWTAMNTGLTDLRIREFAFNGAGIFLGTQLGGVFRSTDNGANWTAMNTGLTNLRVRSFAVSGSNLFAGTWDGVFLSTNNGASWTAVSSGMPSSTIVYSLEMNGSNFFAGTLGNGIFQSPNNAASWTNITTDLKNLSISSVLTFGTNLFVGTFGAGILLLPAFEPSTQSTDIFFQNGTANSVTVNFTDGDGSGHLIVVKAGVNVDREPVDGVTYTPNTVFGNGSTLGNQNYVVGNTSGPVTVTGLVNGTTYTFKVFEYNGSGGTENYLALSGSATGNPVSLSDFTVPQITGNTTPAFVAPNSSVAVSVTVVDNESGVQNVVISYGPANSAILTAEDQNMSNTSGDVWEYTIPAEAVTEMGAVYKIQANSFGGNTPLVPYSVGVTQTGSGLTVPYTSFGTNVSNYRIVSVPLVLSSKTVDDVFGDDLGAYGDKTKWRMYRYDNGTTSELTGSTTIDAGKGYWLIAKTNATISTGTGTTVQANSDTPFEINLKADWNEIGNPYNFNLSWADVQAANPGLPGLRIYNGVFADGSVLKKLEGGFVKVNAPQTLKFPILKNSSVNGRESNSPQMMQNSLVDHDWQVYFNLQQGDLTNTISGFGMNEKASSGFDAFDGFNMPKFFDKSLELNHTKKEGKDYYSSDIVPTSENQVWEFFIESTSDERIITLSWDNTYFGQNEKELYLLDVNLQRSFNMRTINSYSFDKNSSRSFKAVYGSADFVKEKIAVQEMILHNIWPNPSSGDVTLSFSLPESPLSQAVSLSMIDILGRNLWTHESDYTSGYHEVILKRANEETEGVYMIRLTSGSLTKMARLVVK